MNWLDLVGASLSLTCTYYFTKVARIAWVIGIFAIILNGILYWQKGIYGNMLLEILYFSSMIYGWMSWSRKSPGKSRLIRSLSVKEGIVYGSLAVVGITVAQKCLALWGSDVPFWDAITTILSLLAQWLLCLKIMQCWILWFVVDGLVAWMQLYKGIPFHSMVHCAYLGMAVLGYMRWRKILNATSFSQKSLSGLPHPDVFAKTPSFP